MNMKLKLFNKYFFTTSLIIVFSLAFMLLILSFSLDNYIAKTKYKSLDNACGEVTEYITNFSAENKITTNQLHGMLSTVSGVADADIFISDNSGRVLVCGCEE